MTDRELLEQAARAAGMVVLIAPWPDVDGWFFCLQHDEPAMHFRKVNSPQHHVPSWRPLTDDGDALRLAVKRSVLFTDALQRLYHEELAQDRRPSEATRRAIVRAVAQQEGGTA